MHSKKRGRVLVPAMLVALVASGCTWVQLLDTDLRTGGDALVIVAPANRSQIRHGGRVAVEVDFARRVVAGSFRASLRTGLPADAAKVTDQFAVSDAGATATFGADDLRQGITRLKVSARTAVGSRRRVAVVWSWEPKIRVRPTDACDFLVGAKCLMRFPNDYFTVADPASDTGRRVHFAESAMPVNVDGVHVNPREWNRNDGFSPGSSGVLRVTGLDLAVTGAAPITDIQQSLDADSPIVAIDADTLERHPVWAEIDSTATSRATRALYIRPGINFREGHRYIFALRDLKDASDTTIEARRAFRVYRDDYPTFIDAVESRRAHMEGNHCQKNN